MAVNINDSRSYFPEEMIKISTEQSAPEKQDSSLATKKRTERSSRFRIQPYRKLVQFGFLTITVWIGVEFLLFVHQLERGQNLTVSRPPGVEAFLPISALISLKYWLLTGIFNHVHPSALVLLLIVLATAFLFKKGFCSWVCPVGLLSEYLAKIHAFIFDRPRSLPRWLDYPLRSLKYLILAFFLWAIFGQMDVLQLEKFIFSPYNKVADIKMLKFFAEASGLTLRVLIGLFLLSILVRYFWCRYLCPYGALLGATSYFSVFKIHRNKASCIDCEKCTRVCPANIQVHSVSVVLSDECHACLQCVDACPVKDTLYFSATRTRGRFSRKAYAVAIVLIFLLGTTAARLLGYWQNDISVEEYRYHVKNLDNPAYQHNRGQVPEYESKQEASQ
jgi:polyferredoxin